MLRWASLLLGTQVASGPTSSLQVKWRKVSLPLFITCPATLGSDLFHQTVSILGSENSVPGVLGQSATSELFQSTEGPPFSWCHLRPQRHGWAAPSSVWAGGVVSKQGPEEMGNPVAQRLPLHPTPQGSAVRPAPVPPSHCSSPDPTL